MRKKICAVYGEGALTDRTCQKCFVKLCAGDFSYDDAPWSGRPVEVDSNQIETLIENSRYTTWEIANMLKISKSKLLVKMKYVYSLANPILSYSFYLENMSSAFL